MNRNIIKIKLAPEEAIKRLRQETCPATYMPDFDKELCLQVLEEAVKENEILKEIIKSLFDRGCPLHQYNDRRFGLTIEVDKEFLIMHLGEFKGIDLNKKLKEVLEK